jgi:predicted TIM-barrel fold metal-dependent hydrolase
MRIITLEEHMTTERFLAATAPPQPPQGALAQFYQRMNTALLDVGAGRIAAMDEAGIDVQVLSLAAGGINELDTGLAADLATEANEKMAAAVSAYPSRFAAFATLPAQAPDRAAEMLDTYVRRHGFKGAMLDGTVGGKFLDREEFLPIFEAAHALDVPLYLHPAPPPPAVRQAYYSDLRPPLNFLMATAAWGWHVETGMHALQLMASGLFDRLPRLKIIVGHMGENLPYSIARADSVISRAGLPLKRSILGYFQENFWVTNSGYFTVPPILCAKEVIRPDRLMLSVDYPFSQTKQGRDLVTALKGVLSDKELEAFASGNAAKLLRLTVDAGV